MLIQDEPIEARAPGVHGDFTLAVEEPSRDGKPYTVFIGCMAWGKSAEVCGTLQAEDLIALTGKLTWHKRSGTCGQDHSGFVVQYGKC
jgi:single-stranded DNA-binding protein